MISTRCCSPTERSPTRFPASILKPYSRMISLTAAMAFLRLKFHQDWRSSPTTTFSATVSTGVS